MQELFRMKESILGEGYYTCYDGGECVMEYKVDNLMTFREEPLCARSIDGCGFAVSELVKREELCSQKSEQWQELCTRSADENCMAMMEDMEDMGCETVLKEREEREKREACSGFMQNYEELCGGNGKKRAVDPLCAELLEKSEDIGCLAMSIDIDKRSSKKGCPTGWSKLKSNCYRYFPGPMSFNKATDHCDAIDSKRNSHLATLERNLVKKHTAFFDKIIESSGAIDKIDAVLSKMSSHYNNGDWKDMIEYFDDWAWIGVKKIGDDWKWVSEKKNQEGWTNVKPVHTYWVKSDDIRQPTKDGESSIRMDYGNCVTYFRNRDEEISGAWWNVACAVELPFLCQMEVQ